MTLEHFLEIIKNKEYENLKYVYKTFEQLHICEDYIDIYTKNKAFIRFSIDWKFKKISFFKSKKVNYFEIYFFIPEEDKAVAAFTIEENEDMYKTLESLYEQLKEEIKITQTEKYF